MVFLRFLRFLALTQVFILPAAVIQNVVQQGSLLEHLVVSVPFIVAGQLIQMAIYRRRKRNGANEAREERQVSEEDVWYQCGRMGIPLDDAREYVRHLRREAEDSRR